MTRTASFITGSFVVASALALTACGGDAATEAAGPKAPVVIEIGRENVVEVKSQPIVVGPLVSGELKAEREATVRAEIGGAILQVYPREGESIAAGALLARIEGRPVHDAYASAQSTLRSVEQNAEWAQKEAARIETLVKGGALAERDAEVARNAATQAKAAVDDARSRVASARKSLDDLVVKAPIGGIVSKRHVNAGDVVSPGGELYTIIDPSSMRLEASVPSEQIGAIRVGGAVAFQVRGYPNERFEGRIERVSPSADAATRQVPIFVTIPNKQRRLVAGLFAEGRIEQTSKTALVVPQTAVNENGSKPWVLKVEDGKAKRVDIAIGLRDEQTEQLEITSGVVAGDLLLVGAAQGMTPDTPLRVKPQAASSNWSERTGATGMSISDFAIKRPIVTIVMMVAISVFGIFALLRLNTDEFPEVSPPIVSVSIPYPGASPDTVEREVVNPIEEQIASISGVKQIQSSSLDSFGVITVEFYFSKNLQEATQDIRDGISQIRNDLPTEMEEPILTRFDPNDFPIVQLALTSPTLTGPELTRIVDPGVTNQLRGVSGVAEVRVVGGIERELTVELDPQALQATGVGINEVVGALQTQNLAAPVGRINEPLTERTIRLRGRLDKPADFARLVVAQRGGRLIRLGDIAVSKDAAEEPRTSAQYNGRDAVGVDIIKADGASTTDVSARIREKVDAIKQTLPPGVEFVVARDTGPRVTNSVADVQNALVEGAALTVLVVFVFLNSWRSTVITGLALPVSVLASFVAVWAFGFTLNTMSLLGLSLAIGILIDDAIVVRENIVRHIEKGKDHWTAAHDGTSEIALAVAATTFSIVVVFIPIAFMGDLAGQWFKPFALTIACSVLVSLFVSFSLDPMLSAYWPDPDIPMEQRSFVSRGLDKFNRWFDRQTERYKSVIGWALDHRFSMVLLAVASFVGALALPMLGLVGGGFLPDSDEAEFLINIETPPGSSLDYTKLKSEEVAGLARNMSEVLYTYTTIGGRTESVDEAIVYARLKPKSQRERQPIIEARLRAQLVRLGGVTASIGSGNFENQKQIQLQLRGPELAELNRLAQLLKSEVQQVPGAVDVGLSTRGQKPEIDVTVDRGLAGSLGVSVGQIGQTLRVAFAGLDSGDWVDPAGETRDVYVRLKPESRASVRDLAALPLFVPGPEGRGVAVPLGQVAKVSTGLGPARIDRLDRQRFIAIQANTEIRSLNEVLSDVRTRFASNVKLPDGYVITTGGEGKDQAEIFGQIFSSLGLAVLLMYFVLVVQFGSFLEPFAIMLSLPLSLIGVMLGLLVMGSTINIMSMIGVILLMGIVAKNAILLVDFAKWAEEGGLSRREAIIEAGRTRLRPILMTTFALIAGMIPIAIGAGEGADFRAPLGQAVIGGVITSTILTLLVIPTFYEILTEWRDWLTSKVTGKPVAHGHGHAERPHGGVPDAAAPATRTIEA